MSTSTLKLIYIRFNAQPAGFAAAARFDAFYRISIRLNAIILVWQNPAMSAIAFYA
jgi:hypothetical protein